MLSFGTRWIAAIEGLHGIEPPVSLMDEEVDLDWSGFRGLRAIRWPHPRKLTLCLEDCLFRLALPLSG